MEIAVADSAEFPPVRRNAIVGLRTNPPSMAKPWPELIVRYDGLETDSLRAIGSLCRHINANPLGHSIYGWTSLHDLCISQTDMPYPPSGPFLNVSAIGPEEVEFRYLDTGPVERQWHWTVRPEETIARFSRFIEQLRWAGGHSIPLQSKGGP